MEVSPCLASSSQCSCLPCRRLRQWAVARSHVPLVLRAWKTAKRVSAVLVTTASTMCARRGVAWIPTVLRLRLRASGRQSATATTVHSIAASQDVLSSRTAEQGTSACPDRDWEHSSLPPRSTVKPWRATELRKSQPVRVADANDASLHRVTPPCRHIVVTWEARVAERGADHAVCVRGFLGRPHPLW